MEIQVLDEENDTNVQQKFNASTCSVSNKDAKVKYDLAMNITFIYIIDARSYCHTNFTICWKETQMRMY